MAVLGMTMWLVCYCDRTNISLAIVEMETEFGWSESTDGLVLSSFFVGCETAWLTPAPVYTRRPSRF